MRLGVYFRRGKREGWGLRLCGFGYACGGGDCACEAEDSDHSKRVFSSLQPIHYKV